MILLKSISQSNTVPNENLIESDNSNTEYQTSIIVNYSFGSFIRWDVLLSDNDYLSYISSAVHADKAICSGDFGAWSGWSACSSGSNIGSHVLTGIHADPNRPSVRFSFSKYNTKEESKNCSQ